MFYLIPTLFDYVLYGIFFIVGYQLAESGVGALTASAPMAVWGIVYALSASLAGRITTAENAPKLLRLSGWGTALCSLLFIFLTDAWGMLILVGVMGVVSAFYCIPFQMCANSGRQGSTPARAAGFYTFSWSIGTAAGTFGFGCLPGAAGFAVNAAIGLLMVILVGKDHAEKKTVEADSGKVLPAGETVPMIPVWIFGAVGAFCMAAAGALLPLRGVELKTGVFASGAVLGVLRLVQGIAALLLIRGNTLLPTPLLLLTGGVCGASGLLCLTLGTNLLWLFSGSVLFGLCGGVFYFSLVFNALRNGTKSAACLGVNEMILGITGIAGPAAGGMAAQALGIGTAFGGCAVFLLLGGIAAWMTAAIRNKKDNRLLKKSEVHSPPSQKSESGHRASAD